MPEFIQDHGMPTLQEAEHALDKFLLYVKQENKQLLSVDDVQFLMRIKNRVFGTVVGVEYAQ